MKTSTYDTIENYHQLPIAAVESNEPYSVGDKQQDAETREQAKADFIDSNEQWPEVNFPLLSLEDMREAERSLLTMLEAIINDDETDEPIKNVAYEQIALKLAEVYRNLEVIRGLGHIAVKPEIILRAERASEQREELDLTAFSERENQIHDLYLKAQDKLALSRERAGNMSIEIFGGPDKKIFDQFLAKDRHLAHEAMTSEDETTRQIAQEFLSLTGEVDESHEEGPSFELTNETIETLRGDFIKLFPETAELLARDIAHNISAKDSIPHFNEFLQAIGLAEKGWSAESSPANAARTSGKNKKIYIGQKRADFTSSTIKGVPAHEGVAHALRTQNASEQTDPIKRRALPGNLPIEEGIGTSIEQILTGEKRAAGVPFYMSLGLQLGLDTTTGEKRTFRQTHEIMWRRGLLQKASKHGMISEQDIQKTKGTAYQTVIRTTRGNSLDSRDISYFEGGRKASQLLNEIAQLDDDERLEKLKWILSGKFDPTNPLQAEFFDEPGQTN